MTDETTRLNIECPNCGREFTYLHRVGIAEPVEEVVEDDREDQDDGQD